MASPAEPYDPDRLVAIIIAHASLEGPLLPILHAVQAAFGCVPAQAVPIIAGALNMTRAEVHGVVSFYHDFREAPAGARVIRVCRAESCQAVGGDAVAEHLLAALGIGWGGTTPDGAVTVEAVYCLGLCAVSPAALVDGEPLGRTTAETLIAAAQS
jgi:formate dehydrogenase subunit gamma